MKSFAAALVFAFLAVKGAYGQTPMQAQNGLQMIRKEFLEADCHAFMLSRSSPGVVDASATTYYDAFFQGMAMGQFTQTKIARTFAELCNGDPDQSVEEIFRLVMRTLEDTMGQ